MVFIAANMYRLHLPWVDYNDMLRETDGSHGDLPSHVPLKIWEVLFKNLIWFETNMLPALQPAMMSKDPGCSRRRRRCCALPLPSMGWVSKDGSTVENIKKGDVKWMFNNV